MLLNGKALRAIDEDHLLSLIGAQEGKTIDFKETAYLPNPNKSDKWKRDLWIDVSAFANANGGWIICGMNEKGGIADDLCGLGEIDTEGEILRIEQSIKSGIEPVIPGLRLREVALHRSGKGYAIVIYVPPSVSAPHWVRETKKFHVRRSKGNDEMDLSELRRAFNLSEGYETRIKKFHSERIKAIGSDELHNEDVPVPLSPEAHLVLHSIPIMFPDSMNIIDVAVFKKFPIPQWMQEHDLIDYSNYGHFNLDGFIFPYGREAYTQIFRNGVIEYVQKLFTDNLSTPVLDVLDVEKTTLQKLKEMLAIQENFGIESPIIFFMSLVKVKNYKVGKRMYMYYDFAQGQTLISRSNALFPNVVIEDFQQELPKALKSVFDVLWNIGGWTNSESYDNAGNWKRDYGL